MPTYEYQCTSCGKTFEAVQRMSDPALTSCSCGSEGTVHRLMHGGTGLIFKGSGFYITDYKNKGSEAPAKAEASKPADAKTESSSNGASCGAGACPSCAD